MANPGPPGKWPSKLRERERESPVHVLCAFYIESCTALCFGSASGISVFTVSLPCIVGFNIVAQSVTARIVYQSVITSAKEDMIYPAFVCLSCLLAGYQIK